MSHEKSRLSPREIIRRDLQETLGRQPIVITCRWCPDTYRGPVDGSREWWREHARTSTHRKARRAAA
jgi:hypothetical protein